MNDLSLLTFLWKRLACVRPQQIREIGYIKYYVAALLLSTGYEQANAQGVGINTTTPHNSAALDIQSTNKGILIPQVELQSSIDNATIVNPATGLLVYNKNGNVLSGVGFYENTGTHVAPNWEILSRLKLPYSHGTSTNNAFYIQNYQGSSGAIAIKGYSAGVGTGIFAESDNGYALQIKGLMKIFGAGQVPGVGKVLTSDATGEATWQGPTAFSVSGVKGGGGEVVGPGTKYVVPFANENYDTQSSYTLHNQSPASTFTAPVNGIYHFNAKVLGINLAMHLNLLRNGVETVLAWGSGMLVRDVQLLQGDKVYVTVTPTSNQHENINIEDYYTYFTGHLVR
ncbi:C1q-like domain-containing protein [Dyadobacter sp. Leaf189]|uniref:C1q-like domain-containing protein n=1 Tax=Dyadobacter sp. Leaf189 TaxID=1736295 RepID=UPI000712DA6E|nr:hypothetical protein [Dyadobacter sp. Leaf189]KQS26780.1 hypothetical protein ASG33_19695 [Dyadobacter sp. Leaf189]